GADTLYTASAFFPDSAEIVGARIIFHAAPEGESEGGPGGAIYGVYADGHGLERLANKIGDGERWARDQDLEGTTTSGRIILETEFQDSGWAAQLIAATPYASHPQIISPLGSIRFAGSMP